LYKIIKVQYFIFIQSVFSNFFSKNLTFFPMKKIVFSFALAAFAAANVLAQACNADPAYVALGVGIYPQPDSLDIGATANGRFSPLPCAIVGQPYEFTFTAVVPTSYNTGAITLTIQKVDLLSIQNRPPGINYSCNPAGTPAVNGTCTFPSSATVGRCVKLSGTPTTVGLFDMVIKTKIYQSAFFSLNQSFPPVAGDPVQSIKGRYVLGVLPAGSSPFTCQNPTENRSTKGDLSVSARPNPASGAMVFVVGSKKFTENAKFTVTDALGKVVAEQGLTLDAIENNIIDFSADMLPNGMYYYTIESNGDHVTQRFAVQH
jgi:Secretion system C-terminal sorting domain